MMLSLPSTVASSMASTVKLNAPVPEPPLKAAVEGQRIDPVEAHTRRRTGRRHQGGDEVVVVRPGGRRDVHVALMSTLAVFAPVSANHVRRCPTLVVV